MLSEKSKTNPISEYAKASLKVEQELLSDLCDDKFIVSENAWRLSQSGYSSMFIMVNERCPLKIYYME